MNLSPNISQQPSASPVFEGESSAVRRQLVHNALVAEIERYLDAVECFRALGCEPGWRGDPGEVARH